MFLEESLKAAVLYVNGDRVQTNAKEVTSRINDAIGKLVVSVYHKLSYIDTALGEADIRKLFQDHGQQLTLDGVVSTPNSLALHDVSDYINTNTARHMKTSMKTLLDRFTKAPYGFIEADVQWLVAKLFKSGEISFTVNSESVTLLSKSVDEIVRFITRKEYNERLMMEKRVRPNDKQKKAVRDVMKELFGVAAASDDDDAMMASFLNYASRMKTDLEKLEIHYTSQSRYPGKAIINSGKKLMIDLLQIKNATEFFNAVYREQDTYLDFAEDYEPVKKFFGGEQKTIFDRAIRLMTIYDDSRTFIVDDEIEKTVEQIKAIMKKAKPYNEIFKLPGLLDTYVNKYGILLQEMAGPVVAAIDDARKRVLDELEGKLCRDRLRQDAIKRFEELQDKADRCQNVATLQNIKIEADTLKVRCLNEIASMENMMQKQKAALEAAAQVPKQEYGQKTAQPSMVKEKSDPYAAAPQPVIKTHKIVSIKSVLNETTWQMETEADVKWYVAELEKKLLARLEENAIIHIEF